MENDGDLELAERERTERRRYERQLRGQQLVGDDEVVATWIADVAAKQTFRAGDVIYREGSRGDAEGYILYLVLVGEVELRLRGRLLTVVKAGDHFGEFPLVDHDQPWTVDAIARTDVDITKLKEESFLEIANEHPHVWRRMARSLVKRLVDNYGKFQTPNDQAQVFIGSASGVGLDVARELQLLLKDRKYTVRVWNAGQFLPSSTTIEGLEDIARRCDIAVMVATPDDFLRERDVEYHVMRDNVLLEFGIFMGALGRSRALLVHPDLDDLHLPRDLDGLTTIRYSSRSDLESAATEIRKRVIELGPVLERLHSAP